MTSCLLLAIGSGGSGAAPFPPYHSSGNAPNAGWRGCLAEPRAFSSRWGFLASRRARPAHSRALLGTSCACLASVSCHSLASPGRAGDPSSAICPNVWKRWSGSHSLVFPRDLAPSLSNGRIERGSQRKWMGIQRGKVRQSPARAPSIANGAVLGSSPLSAQSTPAGGREGWIILCREGAGGPPPWGWARAPSCGTGVNRPERGCTLERLRMDRDDDPRGRAFANGNCGTWDAQDCFWISGSRTEEMINWYCLLSICVAKRKVLVKIQRAVGIE
jgi:hypothetical protein